MGLTVHYSLKTPAKWSPTDIRAKLEQARQFAKSLPIVSVSELAEFKGREADFQYIRDAGREEQDEFFWAKIQAQRFLTNPWEPGSFNRQPPNHMLVFKVVPAEGSEMLNVGICSYPRHVWKVDKDSHDAKAWSLAFDERNAYTGSYKVMRTFMRRWGLKKLPGSAPRASRQDRFGRSEGVDYFAPHGNANAGIYAGRYLSHRKGYAGSFGLVAIRDRMKSDLYFKFQGSPEEAKKVFASKGFRADLDRMVVGEDFVTPAAFGIWSSCTKTQYANDPRCGGWNNFVKAHLSVLTLLEKMRELGFKVEVGDEGGFWEKRDFGALAKKLGDYDAFVAGMTGAMKDAAGAAGFEVESAMSGRPDFERLEMKGQKTMGELLKRVLKPKGQKADPPSGMTERGE